MLLLTRKIGDSILIGDSIQIQVVKIKGNQVRLGIEAPKDVKIFREEILDNIKKGIKPKADILQKKEMEEEKSLDLQSPSTTETHSPNPSSSTMQNFLR